MGEVRPRHTVPPSLGADGAVVGSSVALNELSPGPAPAGAGRFRTSDIQVPIREGLPPPSIGGGVAEGCQRNSDQV